MDPIAIILTIAACIGGLFLLYVIIAAIAFVIAGRQAKKFLADFDEPHHSPLLGRRPENRR